jgi:hypothetical protein
VCRNTKRQCLQWEKQLGFQTGCGVSDAVGLTRIEFSPMIAKHLQHILKTNTTNTKEHLEFLANKQSIGACQVISNADQSPSMIESPPFLSLESPMVDLLLPLGSHLNYLQYIQHLCLRMLHNSKTRGIKGSFEKRIHRQPAALCLIVELGSCAVLLIEL